MFGGMRLLQKRYYLKPRPVDPGRACRLSALNPKYKAIIYFCWPKVRSSKALFEVIYELGYSCPRSDLTELTPCCGSIISDGGIVSFLHCIHNDSAPPAG
jgi:hypothetical protein